MFSSAAHLQRLQSALKRLFYPSRGVHLIEMYISHELDVIDYTSIHKDHSGLKVHCIHNTTYMR